MAHVLLPRQRSGRLLRSLLCLLAVGCRGPAADPSATHAAPPAAVAIVAQQSLSQELNVAGEFLPYQEVELHAKVAGYLRSITIDIGDHVHRGQLLATLEIPELQAQVLGAEAGVRHTAEEISRAQSAVIRAQADHQALHAAATRLQQAAQARPGLVAEQELDDALARDRASQAQVDVAKSELSAMQQQLGVSRADQEQLRSMAAYSHIVAPFDGIVTWRYADTGALIQSGTSNANSMPVVKLAQVNILRLRLPVPEALAGYIRLGQPARIHVQATGEQLSGTITRSTGSLDAATRSLQVEIDLPNKNGRLTPGMYADVVLDVAQQQPSPVVPLQAVNTSGPSAYVLVVDSQNQVERRPVTLGLKNANSAEVVSGLRAGERVIVANLDSFHSGESVEPRQSGVSAGSQEEQ
jgi:RND family efflux transporter MFP subunit